MRRRRLREEDRGDHGLEDRRRRGRRRLHRRRRAVALRRRRRRTAAAAGLRLTGDGSVGAEPRFARAEQPDHDRLARSEALAQHRVEGGQLESRHEAAEEALIADQKREPALGGSGAAAAEQPREIEPQTGGRVVEAALRRLSWCVATRTATPSNEMRRESSAPSHFRWTGSSSGGAARRHRLAKRAVLGCGVPRPQSARRVMDVPRSRTSPTSTRRARAAARFAAGAPPSRCRWSRRPGRGGTRRARRRLRRPCAPRTTRAPAPGAGPPSSAYDAKTMPRGAWIGVPSGSCVSGIRYVCSGGTPRRRQTASRSRRASTRRSADADTHSARWCPCSHASSRIAASKPLADAGAVGEQEAAPRPRRRQRAGVALAGGHERLDLQVGERAALHHAARQRRLVRDRRRAHRREQRRLHRHPGVLRHRHASHAWPSWQARRTPSASAAAAGLEQRARHPHAVVVVREPLRHLAAERMGAAAAPGSAAARAAWRASVAVASASCPERRARAWAWRAFYGDAPSSGRRCSAWHGDTTRRT